MNEWSLSIPSFITSYNHTSRFAHTYTHFACFCFSILRLLHNLLVRYGLFVENCMISQMCRRKFKIYTYKEKVRKRKGTQKTIGMS